MSDGSPARRGTAERGRRGDRDGGGGGGDAHVRQVVVLGHGGRVAGELRCVRHVNHAHQSAEGQRETFRRVFRLQEVPGGTGRPAPSRSGAEQRRHGERPAVRADRQAVGIPRGGNQTRDAAGGHLHDGDRVDAAAGDEEACAVGRDGQRGWRDARCSLLERLERNRVHDAVPRVSTTDTESSLVFATNSRFRARSHASAVGCSPTGISSVIFWDARSSRTTVPLAAIPRASTTTLSAVGDEPVGALGSDEVGRRPPQLLTYTAVPSSFSATPKGAIRYSPAPADRRPPGSRPPAWLSATSGTAAIRRPRESGLVATARAPLRCRPRLSATTRRPPASTERSCATSGPRGCTDEPTRTDGGPGTWAATTARFATGSNWIPCNPGLRASGICSRTRLDFQST